MMAVNVPVAVISQTYGSGNQLIALTDRRWRVPSQAPARPMPKRCEIYRQQIVASKLII